MVLNNLICGANNEPVNIFISGETISDVFAPKPILEKDNLQINFPDCVAYPGLINSHEHLDFNCFQPLGNKIYNNYTEWGSHIHNVYKEEINAVLKIPQELRTRWGMYKNLLAGVTTVVNHGPVLKTDDSLITVHQEEQCLHSVKFEKFWKWKLNNPLKKNKPCVIHIGEGTNNESSKEIDELLKWNLLTRELIGIHGVAMNTKQAQKFKALAWCPESNHYLLNTTADIKNLKENTAIVFGTDSTLTGNWNIWQHLRFAANLQQVSNETLFEMVTKTAAGVWGMNSGEIRKNKNADIIIVKNKKEVSFYDLFFETNPEDMMMVIHKGKIRMFDPVLYAQLQKTNFNAADYNPVNINGTVKYVTGNLPKLLSSIKEYYPMAIFPCSGYSNDKN